MKTRFLNPLVLTTTVQAMLLLLSNDGSQHNDEIQRARMSAPLWWNDDRFCALEKEAGVNRVLVSGLRIGQRTSGIAHSSEAKEIKEEIEDGVATKRIEKKMLGIATVSTAPPKQASDHAKTEILNVNHSHQRR